MPRTKIKGDWVLPEAAVLDRLVGAYLPGIRVPDDEPEPRPLTAKLTCSARRRSDMAPKRRGSIVSSYER